MHSYPAPVHRTTAGCSSLIAGPRAEPRGLSLIRVNACLSLGRVLHGVARNVAFDDMTNAGVDVAAMLASAAYFCWGRRHNACQLDDKCVDDLRFYQLSGQVTLSEVDSGVWCAPDAGRGRPQKQASRWCSPKTAARVMGVAVDRPEIALHTVGRKEVGHHGDDPRTERIRHEPTYPSSGASAD